MHRMSEYAGAGIGLPTRINAAVWRWLVPWGLGQMGRIATLTEPCLGYPACMDVAGQAAADALEPAGGLLAGAERVVVFSGAGVSTDSRIIV
jgi:hypothetical protein